VYQVGVDSLMYHNARSTKPQVHCLQLYLISSQLSNQKTRFKGDTSSKIKQRFAYADNMGHIDKTKIFRIVLFNIVGFHMNEDKIKYMHINFQ
jgi:hypothetical protein